MQLLRELVGQPHLCFPDAFGQYCSRNREVGLLLSLSELDIYQVFKEMEPNEFWAFVTKNPWLLGLISENGNGQTCFWNQLLQQFPDDQLQSLKQSLTPVTLVAPVELGNWFYYADGYVGLKIEIDQDAKQPVEQSVTAPVEKKAVRPKALPKKESS